MSKQENGSPSDAEILAALERAGVEFQRFMGGIGGSRDIHTTSGSQRVGKIIAGVRAVLADHAASVASQIPIGWRLHIVEASMNSTDSRHPIWVKLIRDPAGKAEWHKLPCPEHLISPDAPLYAQDSGATFELALAAAIQAAHQADLEWKPKAYTK